MSASGSLYRGSSQGEDKLDGINFCPIDELHSGCFHLKEVMEAGQSEETR